MMGGALSHHFPPRKIFTEYDNIFVNDSSCRTVFLVAESPTRILLWFYYIHTVTTSTGINSDSIQ